MIVKEIKCKSCLVKSKLTDYVVNPYTGCSHGCKYCYASFIRRFQNIKEKWGEFVYVKSNCADLLDKELEKSKGGHIWMSSVCDCYMPIEKKYGLTRKILEKIIKYKDKFDLEILTKSVLVKRDFDLLNKLDVELGMSINTLDDKKSKLIEPFASPSSARLKVLKKAKKSGIKVFGFISPVIPGITDLEELFRELKFVDYVWVELLNTKRYIANDFVPFLKKNGINLDLIYLNSEEYYNKIKKEVEELSRKYNLKVVDIVRH